MARGQLLGSALLLGGVLFMSGCGAGPEVPAVPPVPAIDNPKDVRGMDPCALLPAEQTRRFGPPERGSAAEGPHCGWRGDGAASLAVTLYVGGGGLATLAQNSEPTTSRVRIEGYPALETFTARGEFCQYDVSVAGDQVILASMTGGAPDSCTALQRVLAPMLAGIPPLRG